MRTKSCLTLSDAKAIMDACRAEAEKHHWKVAVSIVDEGGYQILMERMDGAALTTPEVAKGKARSAALSRIPTKFIEDTIKERPAMLTFPDRLGVQGGVPIIHEGECIGGIGVSGVKSAEDEQVALAGSKVLAPKA